MPDAKSVSALELSILTILTYARCISSLVIYPRRFSLPSGRLNTPVQLDQWNSAANGFEKLLGNSDQNLITRTNDGMIRKPNAIWNRISPLVQPAMLLLLRRSSFDKESIIVKKVDRVDSSSGIKCFFELAQLIGRSPLFLLLTCWAAKVTTVQPALS